MAYLCCMLSAGRKPYNGLMSLPKGSTVCVNEM
jgi:hypothetical protein